MKKFFKTALAICLLVCIVCSFGACNCGEKSKKSGKKQNSEVQTQFECTDKFFVYDSWEATEELSESDRLILEGMILEFYGKTQFTFNADETYSWYNVDTGDITSEGNWRIENNAVILSIDGDDTQTLQIVGTKFYVVQNGNTYDLHIYYRLG